MIILRIDCVVNGVKYTIEEPEKDDYTSIKRYFSNGPIISSKFQIQRCELRTMGWHMSNIEEWFSECIIKFRREWWYQL